MAKNLYLISSNRRSGKSNMALGIMEVLMKDVEKVAFFRPIIHIDHGRSVEDNFSLIKKYFNLSLDYDEMYAYTYDEAESLVNKGKYDELIDNIVEKYKRLADAHNFVLIEGTDYRGNIAILEHINAKIADVLSSPILILTPARDREIEKIMESIQYYIDLFTGMGCKIVGTIVTRAKEERCHKYLGYLIKQPVFENKFVAVMPESSLINTPTMGEIANFLKATIISGEDQLIKQVRHYSTADMNLGNFLWTLQDSSMIITSADRVEILLGSILANQSMDFPDISGIILTSAQNIDERILTLIKKLPSSIPICTVPDTVQDTLKKLENLKITLLPENKQKIAIAHRIFDAYIDKKKLAQTVIASSTDRITPKMFEFSLIEKARKKKMHIVLPEGIDERMLRATETLVLRDVVNITLLGNQEQILQKINELGLSIKNVTIIDPLNSEKLEEYADILYDLRKNKGMTKDHSVSTMTDVNYYGTMMVHLGDADGMVSGAIHSTANTVRPALQIIKTVPGIPVVSSVFIMCLKDRVLLYGDCAVNPNPTSEELAHIAVSSADTAITFGIEPRVAMLSYSSGSSGKGEDVELVREATKIAKSMRPELKIEGPIQYDAAVSEKVAKTKLPDSEVAGRATVFIFPDLNTGNNTYKAVQRETGALAIGPISQGMNKPVNDLSRGCTTEDILNTIIITAIQAQILAEKK